ncbi:MAG TPA: hypothetical protein VGP07_02080 [Polyangia bacterium]|jgi:hypothetical protein
MAEPGDAPPRLPLRIDLGSELIPTPTPTPTPVPTHASAELSPRRFTRVRGGIAGWVGARFDHGVARFLDLRARRGATFDQDGETALTRVGGPIARWVSFPKGVRTATAAMSVTAAGFGVWGILAAGSNAPFALLVGSLGVALASTAGPLGVRLANRLHRLISHRRRFKISELRGVPDRRAVAVRGVVLGRRATTSTMDSRAVVWSLTRFRLGRSPLARAFFHEVAFDFLIDDGTDEPIWIEVSGGMVIDRFPGDRRIQFQSTTLLDIDHPFLTQLRLRDRKLRAAEISIAPGDIVDVVGRLSRRLDPSAPSDSGREPPQRRALRSGTRVPVMVRKVLEPDLELARVRRLAARATPDISPGEPPLRRF